MKYATIFLAAALLGGGASLALVAHGQRGPTPARTYSAAAQEHADAAYLLAGNDMPSSMIPTLSGHKCTPGNCKEAQDVAPPVKAFDQLAYLGMRWVGSWALVTSGGIIQFDALNNSEEAQRIIEGGYRKLGLDPAQIKYLVITHAHADHCGGAKYLQDKYHPHVLMSAADWDVLASMPPARNPNSPPPPTRDMDVTDGEKLTVGETTVTLYITPGHTPGTISAIIPVTDHGLPHLLSFWGGTGFPQGLDPTPVSGGLREYARSLDRFIKIGEDVNVDGVISNHPEHDGTFEKTQQIQSRKPGDPNLWVIGESGYVREMFVIREFLQAEMIMAEEQQKSHN